MSVMAWSLSNEDRAQVRQAFIAMDKDHSGTISREEFLEMLCPDGFRSSHESRRAVGTDGQLVRHVTFGTFSGWVESRGVDDQFYWADERTAEEPHERKEDEVKEKKAAALRLNNTDAGKEEPKARKSTKETRQSIAQALNLKVPT
jgi:hypothetical protein